MKNTNVQQHSSDCDEEFLKDILDGLSHPQKNIPSKYFYNEKGSQLFDQICELDEYYLTRTELALLKSISGELDILLEIDSHLLEPGAGSGDKLQLLLGTLTSPQKVTLLDISPETVISSGAKLRAQFPHLDVQTVVGDFTKLHDYHPHVAKEEHHTTIFFPGSTIGNFSPIEASQLLSSFASIAGHNGALIIGVDQIKSTDVLEKAYNDAQGVTAEFNLNLLERINNELNGTFNPNQFYHKAFYNSELSRIEMHLYSRSQQTVHVNGHPFEFEEGESIHTENSYKYSYESFCRVAKASGWRPVAYWQDPNKWFGLHYLQVDSQENEKGE
ncbi:MAG: L-histidine N(alpha)-methyltransferase [Aestuariibacter sp.]